MVALVAPQHVLADTLCCVGLGFLLAVLYDMARFALGNAKLVCFVLDLLAFLLAAVLLCSFAASRSFSGVVRWFMSAGLLAGLVGYFYVLAPATQRLQIGLKWLLSRPFVLVWIVLVHPLYKLCTGGIKKICHRINNVVVVRRKKQLKSKGKMLYNSNN